MIIPTTHTSVQGQVTTQDGQVIMWCLSPRVYQGSEDYIGDVSISFTRVNFHASRDSVSVMLPPEVAAAIAEGMSKALSDLHEMLRVAREGIH